MEFTAYGQEIQLCQFKTLNFQERMLMELIHFTLENLLTNHGLVFLLTLQQHKTGILKMMPPVEMWLLKQWLLEELEICFSSLDTTLMRLLSNIIKLLAHLFWLLSGHLDGINADGDTRTWIP